LFKLGMHALLDFLLSSRGSSVFEDLLLDFEDALFDQANIFGAALLDFLLYQTQGMKTPSSYLIIVLSLIIV